MALIETGMYSNAQSPDYVGNFQRGLLAGQQYKQNRMDMASKRREQEDAQKFDKTLRGLMAVSDTTTPEGRMGLVRDLNTLGYGKQALGLMAQFQEMAPKPVQPEFETVDSDQGLFNKNKATGAITPMMNGGKPLMKAYAPTKPTPERFQLVKNKRGQMVSVDVSTGLDKNGQPVDAWQDPIKPDAPKSTDVFSQEQQLRTQYLGQTKDFRDVRDAYGRIQSSAKDPSAAGDLALIFNYMKMLDPGSTVREGEFANAQNAGGVPERIWSSYNKLKSGERLSPPQRADFMMRAKGLYSKAEFQKKKTQSEYRKMASSYPGLNPDRVLMDDGLAAEPTPAAPTSAPAESWTDADEARYQELLKKQGGK